MSKKEKRSRGPERISEEEYKEICREEDKKMLDPTFIEPNTIDGKKYEAILKEIHSNYIEYRDLSILSFNYSVKLGEDSFKDVEDPYFLDNNNSRSFEVNEERLERMLRKFGVALNDDDFEDVKSLEKAVKHLVGKKVTLVQNTNREFKNYKIVEVLD